LDYTIIGGAVNLASRLESEAESGQILISYETYARVKDEVFCEEVGEIQVKGMAYKVATYRVIGLRDELDRQSQDISEDIPHFKLSTQPHLMSDDERRTAADVLKKALASLSKQNKGKTGKKPTRSLPLKAE